MAAQTSFNPPTDYPLWIRCAASMAAVASFPAYLMVLFIGDALPWQIGILAVALSSRGLSVLTCPKPAKETLMYSLIRDTLVSWTNRAPKASIPGKITGPQESAVSQGIASGTKTAA